MILGQWNANRTGLMPDQVRSRSQIASADAIGVYGVLGHLQCAIAGIAACRDLDLGGAALMFDQSSITRDTSGKPRADFGDIDLVFQI